MFLFVMSTLTATSEVTRPLPGDQVTRFALANGLRKGKGERRHQGEEEELKMHDGKRINTRDAMQETEIH